MTILQRLKLETHQWHVALESRVDIQRRIQQRDSYRELLAAFYGFYAPLEQRLSAAAVNDEIGLDFSERTKFPWLTNDLQALGADPSSTPQCNDLPQLSDGAAALGCLYVLEGATLGGRYVTKMLQPLGITASAGGAFFHSYGEATRQKWAEFQAAVVEFSTTEKRAERVVATAVATFQCFDAWLAQRLSSTA